MKARSFWRFFSAFMLVTLATVILFTAVMTLALQRERPNRDGEQQYERFHGRLLRKLAERRLQL